MQSVDALAEMLAWQRSDRRPGEVTDAMAEGVRTGQPTAVGIVGGDALGVPTSASIACSATVACALVTAFEVG